jgi:hypothetical protein
VVPGVLVVVDEDCTAIAILPPPGGGHVLRRSALHLSREGERSPAYICKAPPWFDPHIDVQAGTA